MCRLPAVAACVASAFSGFVLPANAAGKHAALVIDANTNIVISAQDADAPRFPASLTKMMTLYLLFDQIEQGRLAMTSRIKVSDTAASAQPSKLGLDAGAEITVADAIKALIVKSANDIAVAVAEQIAGSEEKFARRMTEKARQLGMTATSFRNAHGLPDDAQTTTARDMVTLALRLHDDFPRHYPLFATREFRFNGETHRNHNTLLFSYEGAEGMKTGYTRAAGFNLVTSVKRGNKHVIGVVFGGSSAGTRNQTMKTLLNIALFKASPTKTRQPVAIAQAKPRPQPVPELREAIRPAPRTTVTADASRAAALQSDARPSTAIEPPIAPTSEPPKPSRAVEVARVRSVLVVPRQAPPVAALPPSVPAAPITTLTPQPPAFVRADAAPRALPPPARALPPPPQPIAQPTPPVAGQVVRGAPPSSLQTQAENLARGAAPATPVARPTQFAQAGTAAFRLQGPAQPTSQSYQIQIGAYASAADAERQLATAKARAADLIGSYQGAALTAQVAGKAIYRARLIGLDSTSATSVCTELRRRQIDCMVAKAE